MPVAVALLIRTLIQATVQVGIFLGLEKLLGPLTDKAKRAVADAFNMTEEEAQDTVANEIIDAFAMIGIIGVSIRTKLPTTVAERLGFTSKGYTKRKISNKLPAEVTSVPIKAAQASQARALLTTAEATTAIERAKLTLPGFGEMYKIMLGTLGVVFMGFMAVGNWIDFGNWNSGAYQKTMQKVLAFVTGGLLVPDEDYRKAKTASDDVFGKVFNAYKLAGVVGIQDPFKFQSLQFTRDNLMDVVDQVGATLLLSKGSAGTADVLAATQLFMVFGPGAGENLPAVSTPAVVSSGSSPQIGSAVSRVFTGIVSQGVLGPSVVFTPRPDDLIESVKELEDASSNNLSAYLATVLGKIVYELKIVSSVITKDGFKQTGKTQRIPAGTYANGTTKYKTVTNKFATLTVYAVTDKGSRAKLTTIVLGPTDTAKLQLGQEDLRTLEAKLPALVTTTKLSDIEGIETPQEDDAFDSAPASGVSVPAQITTYSGEPAPVANTPTSSSTVLGSGATTLFEWYSAQGQQLPTVSERALIYERLGLGSSAYYAGTAEQNTRLLVALKAPAVPTKGASSTSSGSNAGSSSKSNEPTQSRTTTKTPERVTVVRSYTTTSGERVIKYSNGTEKRRPAK